MYEATFHGVPIVGVPFMLEQAQNAKRCAARGFGVVSPEAPALRKDGRRYTREGVAALIRQVGRCCLRAAGHLEPDMVPVQGPSVPGWFQGITWNYNDSQLTVRPPSEGYFDSW